ncbi:MAG: GGDEF domain-containing protein [Candidatus Competibacter sp.]|nr:GGDEF domain-containing protein [Candidatus Competibacter sp.]MDG4584880.1 GGDEF domain-containing protein [Candidatus Competibacter sp.]
MSMQDIMQAELAAIYTGHGKEILAKIAPLLEPELPAIVDVFYDEFLRIPEPARILKHHIVQKNLRLSLAQWIASLFAPHQAADIPALVERQKHIGMVHAGINVNLSYFTHGISILKREIYQRLKRHYSEPETFSTAFILIDQLFDLLTGIIAEAYFLSEITYETNELSLKMKGVSLNAAIECERLRASLLDWLRATLTLLYQAAEPDPNSLPKLQYSNFGLWVIYKADLLSHTLHISTDLKKQIREIDDALFQAARYRAAGENERFFEAIGLLNDAVTKTSWFISSLVDQMMEIDSGLDILTRLFNRRYLDTILRRQTDISLKQGLPYAVLVIDLDHFKQVNDRHGHESGDILLKSFAELLLLSVRTSDFIFRYGGEEFLIVLGNVEVKEALGIAEKIRSRCEMQAFRLAGDLSIRQTCSIGIGIHDGHPDYARTVRQADAALYEAKKTGRNRTIVATE